MGSLKQLTSPQPVFLGVNGILLALRKQIQPGNWTLPQNGRGTPKIRSIPNPILHIGTSLVLLSENGANHLPPPYFLELIRPKRFPCSPLQPSFQLAHSHHLKGQDLRQNFRRPWLLDSLHKKDKHNDNSNNSTKNNNNKNNDDI